jgi:GntR family transcriptional regulator, transcriptional repressor for pyruvate dehydrogenase complex
VVHGTPPGPGPATAPGPGAGPGSERARLVATLPREQTLANRVVVELERLIVESRLGEGDRLPSERELAAQFGVSRTVIREAVRALSAKRLIHVAGGRGMVVRAPSTQAAAESMRLLLRVQESVGDAEKVAEVRRVLENEIATLAAARRTTADLAALAALLDAAGEHVDQPDAFIDEDVEFHAALARATHNELFSILLDSLAQVMFEVRLLALRVPGTPRRSLMHHQAVYAAVAAGDAAAARDAMDRHMDEARETLTSAVSPDEDS